MDAPEDILKKYFGHDTFRPMQKEIVESVLKGNDTIALLSTGGGKSVCFQVPALMSSGVCIVVTPLIALMKDQVENLRKKDIPALALFSGMGRREIEFELENCVNGKYKFLYLSPERLMSRQFLDYALHMEVSMLAVDEAHCISQWGYDFRPPYLRIAEFLQQLHNIRCIALTASATPEVVKDISAKLGLRSPKIFNAGFVRENLSYVVRKDENKTAQILNVCRKIEGSGLVYVNSRRKTEQVSALLLKNGIVADHYHAGLDARERTVKQDEWKAGKTRVMVCTNAFGMGIDKPDVRFVVHEQKPDTLEAYYQEAGRAGRDGKRSFCILLYHDGDFSEDKKNAQLKYPAPADIERTYEMICNYLKVAVGSGKGESFTFDLSEAAAYFGIGPKQMYNALRILESDGYFTASEAVYLPSRLKILLSYSELYEWQLQNEEVDLLFKVMLRSYGGLFDFYTPVFENEIARRMKRPEKWVREQLIKLKSVGIIDYIPQNNRPQLLFLEQRLSSIHISKERIEFLRKRYLEKLEQMNRYIRNRDKCRSTVLVNYFGETDTPDCGICDICIEKKTRKSDILTFEACCAALEGHMREGLLDTSVLQAEMDENELKKTLQALRWLADNGYLEETRPGKWKRTERKQF